MKAYINYAIKRTIKEFCKTMKIYSIKDTVTGNFSAIVTAVADGVIIRDIQNALKNADKTNDLVMNSKDKDLYRLGDYDLDTGIITSNVEFITHVNDLKENVE